MNNLICIPVEMFVNQNQYDKLCVLATENNMAPTAMFEMMIQAGSAYLINDRLLAYERIAENARLKIDIS